MYRSVATISVPLANGRTLEPGDEVPEKDVDPEDPNDRAHLESGRLRKIESKKKSQSAASGGDGTEEGEKA